MFYLVLEIQINNGAEAHIVTAYSDMNQAWSKYYTVLAAAAISDIDQHSCALLDDTGFCYEHKVFWKENKEGE